MDAPKIIAIVNPKGGVGKTTTSINLATSLAVAEKKVLLIDLDPNGAVALGLGIPQDFQIPGTYELIQGTAHIREAIWQYELPVFDVIPALAMSDDRETRLLHRAKNRHVLKQKLTAAASSLDYDFIIIDTPPLLNDLTLLGMTAAHSVLIPLNCSYFAVKVLQRLFSVIQKMRYTYNRELYIEGAVLNDFDSRTRESKTAQEETEKVFGDLLFKTVIPKNTAIGFAFYQQQPVIIHDAMASGSFAFMEFASELIQRNEASYQWAEMTKSILAEPELLLRAV